MYLSVVIPTRNRARTLAETLRTFAALKSVSFDWEIIVVDNGSTDETAAVVSAKQIELPNLRVVSEPEPGLHYGRHRGAYEAQGTLLAYLDDDVLLQPSWLYGSEIISAGQADVVTGRVLPKWEAEPPPWVMDYFNDGVCGYLSLLDLGDQARPIDSGMVFGGNMFLRRADLFAAGGFHPDGVPPDRLKYRGDGENALAAKLASMGREFYYTPIAGIYHVIDPQRLTIDYFKRRAYQQGISDSFSQLRAQAGLPGYHLPHTEHPIQRLLRKSPAQIARAVLRRLPGRSEPFAAIHKAIRSAYHEGFQFHQQSVAQDDSLRRYVLQPTYLSETHTGEM